MVNYRTFTWRPKFDSEETVSHRVLSVQFGDGYEQSVGDGINTRREVWSLMFEGHSDKIDAIKEFLDEHKSYIPFKWENSNGKVITVKAKGGYRHSRQSNKLGTDVSSLSVTFEEAFL